MNEPDYVSCWREICELPEGLSPEEYLGGIINLLWDYGMLKSHEWTCKSSYIGGGE